MFFDIRAIIALSSTHLRWAYVRTVTWYVHGFNNAVVCVNFQFLIFDYLNNSRKLDFDSTVIFETLANSRDPHTRVEICVRCAHASTFNLR